MLEARQLRQVGRPDWLDFGIHARRRKDRTGDCVLVLVEETHVLQAN